MQAPKPILVDQSPSLQSLRNLALELIYSLRMLSLDRAGNIRDLQGRDLVDHFVSLAKACKSYVENQQAMDAGLQLFAQVSRQPVANLFVSGLSTTEFVIRSGLTFLESIERLMNLSMLELTNDQMMQLRAAWPTVREPYDNSPILPTFSKSEQLAVDIEWEYRRALALPAVFLLTQPEKAQLDSPPVHILEVAKAQGTLPKPIEIFYSYSHEDEKFRVKLETHLSLLKHQRLISGWHFRKIGAGNDFKDHIDKHLDSAGIILLLVSAEFLASAYCYDIEMIRALARHDAGLTRVIPIILKPCDWKTAPFGKLNVLPTGATPLTKWTNRDEGFTDVALGIRAAVMELTAAPQHNIP